MQKIEFKWAALTASVVIICVAFYWFEYRPSAARKACASSALEGAKNVFTRKIQTGEFTGDASGDWNLSKAQLLRKYAGYSNYMVRDTLYRQCLESKGLTIEQKWEP